MYPAPIQMGRIRTALETHITQLGKVTVTLVKPENCVSQSKLHRLVIGPMENALEFLISPAPN